VFSVVRHPVYLSEILLYLGLLMLSISLAAAVVWIIAIGFLHYISRIQLTSATVNDVRVLKNTSYGVRKPRDFLGR